MIPNNNVGTVLIGMKDIHFGWYKHQTENKLDNKYNDCITIYIYLNIPILSFERIRNKFIASICEMIGINEYLMYSTRLDSYSVGA